MQNQISSITIWLSIIVALILSLIKLPLVVDNLVPNYVPMVVLYWAIISPTKVNVGVGWFAGLLMDFLMGATLGLHAIAFALMVWIVVTQFENIAFYSLLQKTIVVGFVNFIGQFLLFWTEHIFGVVTADYSLFWSCFFTLILWPLLYGILNLTHSFNRTYEV
jgi:rod shape-determining protein MreD